MLRRTSIFSSKSLQEVYYNLIEMKIQSGMILNKAVKYQIYDMHVYVNSESMKYFVILVSLPKSICKSVSID